VPLYTYKAVSPEGRMVSAASTPSTSSTSKCDCGAWNLTWSAASRSATAACLISGGVPRRELIHFCFHLQQLVRAGVPILEGLTDLRDSLEHPRFREVVASLIESIEGGQTLSQAMESHPRVFDKVFVSLIRAGETTGRLPEVLQSLNESLKWEDELASQPRR
jgi:type IV pilus assembly protein PilC